MRAHLEDLGGPKSFENYPIGWAWSLDTPFQWAKEVASHFGGTRNGLVISWPGHTRQTRQVRSQFHHVIDIVPTLYEAAGIKPPAEIDGVKQSPLQGVSMVYTFDHPEAPSTHHSQYFEMLGNRAFYEDGWIASSTPEHMPWSHKPATEDASQYKWELYDLRHDYSQARDLAAQMPEKLGQLQQDFASAAQQFNVLPLSADVIGRLDPDLRPSLTQGRSRFVYFPASTRYSAAAIPNLSHNWRLQAEVEIPGGDPSGMVAVRGDWFGGWGLFADHGRPVFVYRASDQQRDIVEAAGAQPLAPGRHTLGVAVRRVAGTTGGDIVLSVDGKEAAKTHVERFGRVIGDLFVGRSGYVPLVDGQRLPLTFGGQVQSVTLDLQPEASR